MSTDLSAFIETFQEESREGLDLIEANLLQLERGDPEAIHAVFRAAHSIKGGAGTFGFTAIADFTHGVETLLDQMREGRRTPDAGLVALLLEATDCVRSLLDGARDGTEVDAGRIQAVRERVEAELGAAVTAPAEEREAAETADGWHIRFVPAEDFFGRGHDPVAMFRALGELGTLEVQVDTSRLPHLETLDPERCHLSWTLLLRGAVPRAEILEIFEWVMDECTLEIEPLAPPPAAETTSIVAVEPTPTAGEVRRPAAETASIRVNTKKIDQLVDMVGELVITRSMLSQIGAELGADTDAGDCRRLDRLSEGLAQLERNTRELQESIMAIRMVPVSFAFNRFPRLVRDTATRLGKHIELTIEGEATEMDKTLIEKIGDPLVHLVRNAVDHGIEMPDDRRAAGKSEVGHIHLEAGHRGGNVVIEIRDDGRGLDRERILARARERGLIAADAVLADSQVLELIFAPGFSTAQAVSDLSGRGVGMDVVRRNIHALGGDVELQSQVGKGTTIRIVLPLTLAILDGQAVRVGGELYVIPLVSILESIHLGAATVHRPAGAVDLLHWREEHLPLLDLRRILEVAESEDQERGLVVVVEGGGYRAGLAVDDLLAQQQVVIKSLEDNFQRVDGVSGATILGDGSVALILDVAGIIKLAGRAPDARASTEEIPA